MPPDRRKYNKDFAIFCPDSSMSMIAQRLQSCNRLFNSIIQKKGMMSRKKYSHVHEVTSASHTGLPQACHEPSETENGETRHPQGKPDGPPVVIGQAAAAGGTNPTGGQRRVRTARVQAKRQARVCTQITSIARVGRARVGVVDDQLVLLCQQRRLRISRASIPRIALGRFVRHVRRQGPGRGGRAARRQHVDAGWGGYHVGIVP